MSSAPARPVPSPTRPVPGPVRPVQLVPRPARPVRPVPRPTARSDSPSGAHPAGGPGRRPAGPAGPRPDGGPGRRRTRSGQLDALVESFAQLYLEVESGRRPPAQAKPFLLPKLAAQLEQVWVRPGVPGHVVRVTGVRAAVDAYEAVAVVRRSARAGAIAIRLVRRGGRWVVAEASRPEDGPLPEPAYGFPDDDDDDAFDILPAPAGAAPALEPVGEGSDRSPHGRVAAPAEAG